ncbi:MAG: hypothetical protein ABWK00_06060 [Desulfurococcaceae archaeon]
MVGRLRALEVSTGSHLRSLFVKVSKEIDVLMNFFVYRHSREPLYVTLAYAPTTPFSRNS